jgi:hypothetical protein
VNATALHAAPPWKAPADVPAGRRRAVLTLSRVESVRLLRHPITLAAVLFLIVIWVSGWFTNQANRYPVLPDADRDTQLGMMLLLGGAALIAGNLAVLRPYRDGTTALSEVLVLPMRLRTAAHLLAVLPLGLLAVALTGLRVTLLALALAAGRPNPYELVTGPVLVLLLGALGVLLGRLTRSAIVAPLMLLGLLALLVVVPLLARGGAGRWFQPVVPDGEAAFGAPAPAYLMARPAGAHLAYLAGLAVFVAVAALARSGARSVGLILSGVVALAVTVAGAVVQVAPPSDAVGRARTTAMLHPSTVQTCRRLDRVTYCAFPDFTAWIPGWDTEVRGVLRRVPMAVARQPLAVRQRIVVLGSDNTVPDPTAAWRSDDAAAGTPGAVSVGTRWGDSRSSATLAALVAYRLVAGDKPSRRPTVCGAPGVLVAWLAGQATAKSHTGLRLLGETQARQHSPEVLLSATGVEPGIGLPYREFAMATELLDRPADQVGAQVLRSWDELTSTRTSIERAAQIFGVPVPADSSARNASSPDARQSGACS